SYFIEFNSKFTIALAEYGIKFSAVIQKDNFYGVQFHPEKSGLAGEQLLKNFSQLT
ncbi:MAG: imidazole glycerol phosphate synthase subunit HisH, partial [Daejeonella sp.]